MQQGERAEGGPAEGVDLVLLGPGAVRGLAADQVLGAAVDGDVDARLEREVLVGLEPDDRQQQEDEGEGRSEHGRDGPPL